MRRVVVRETLGSGRSAINALLFTVLLGLTATALTADRWRKLPDGSIRVDPLPVDRAVQSSPWSKQLEDGFWIRANHVIEHTANGSGRYGSTWFESEKRSYGWAMLSVIGGFKEAGMKFLEAEDAAAKKWNQHTLGIDLFPCFTLKHQTRKFFYFGDALTPAYRKRMRAAAKIFTEKDPLGRPHSAFTGETGWGPNAKNSWVDVRSTDNLKLMRETSVYLFAEDAGNESTRLLYKKRLSEFIVTMYYTGMGEWDSENYLGHSIVPLLNLYDFAKDMEVKRLAKAGLDWMATAAALKYWRGSFNGPTRRDYNHPYPFGGSAASIAWLWFGDSPSSPDHFESDEIHPITSAYRPPLAVVNLARKTFPRPVEIFASKPDWAAWKNPSATSPTFHETQYFGKDFLFGTLVRGTQSPDVNGFKILTYSKDRGADTIVAAPTKDPLLIGSPMYRDGVLAPNSALGQNRNLAIYLTEQSDHPYLWLVPRSAKVVQKNGVTFIVCERSTIAIWPLNLSSPRVDAELTDQIRFKTKKSKKKPSTKVAHWSNSTVLKATRSKAGVYGFAIEIGEGDAKRFMERAAKIRPEADELAIRGAAAITGVGGARVRLQWGNTKAAIKIWRDGKYRDLESAASRSSYHTMGDRLLIDQAWQGDGRLRVNAGGWSFTSTVSRDGAASFEESKAD